MIKKYKELFEERAGILEFDGGFTRQKAEEKATAEIVDFFVKEEKLPMNKSETYAKINQLKRELKKC